MSNPQIKIKKMKKFLFSLGLIAMAFNLTNCAQYEEATPITAPQGDFELFASNASIARTANDGVNTLWATSDALNVFHAVTDMTEYTLDGKFTLASGSTDRFTGNLNGELDPQEEYDWYVIYPYEENRTSPTASDKKGYTGVGCYASSTQKQNGYNSTKHLSGVDFPIAGVKKAVSAASAPTVAMKNLASVLAFNITNTIDAEVVVKSVTFTAPESIIGTYYINFTDIDNVVFTDSGDYYVSKSATVEVSNGTALAKGALATVYMGIKPFTAAAGSEFTVSVTADVNGVESVYTKTVNSEKGIKFSSNTIKSFPVNFEAEIPSAEDIVEVIDFSKQGYANATEVLSFNGEYCSIALNKGTNSQTPKYYTTGTAVRCYGGNYFTISSESLKIKKVVFTFSSSEADEQNCSNTITATPETFTTDTWVGSAESIKFTISGTGGHRRIQKITITYGEPDPTIVATDPAAFAYNTTTATISYKLLALTGTVTATEDAEWITAVDCSTEGAVVLTLTENTSYDARTADVTLSKEGAEDVVIKVTQSGKPRPTLTLPTATVPVDSDATSATIKYNYANLIGDVTATADAEWVKSIDCSTLGQVVVTFDANTGDERSAKITISSTDATDVTATITQAEAGASAEPITATLSFANKAQRTSWNTSQQTWEQNGIKLVNEKGSSTSNVADYANPARFYKSSKITITAPGKISKIVFTANTSAYATALKNSVQSTEGSVSASGSNVTITPASQSETFVISSLTGGQVRVNSVTVTYLP